MNNLYSGKNIKAGIDGGTDFIGVKGTYKDGDFAIDSGVKANYGDIGAVDRQQIGTEKLAQLFANARYDNGLLSGNASIEQQGNRTGFSGGAGVHGGLGDLSAFIRGANDNINEVGVKGRFTPTEQLALLGDYAQAGGNVNYGLGASITPMQDLQLQYMQHVNKFGNSPASRSQDINVIYGLGKNGAVKAAAGFGPNGERKYTVGYNQKF